MGTSPFVLWNTENSLKEIHFFRGKQTSKIAKSSQQQKYVRIQKD